MKRDVDRSYLAIVVLLMLVLPLASLLIETREPGLALVGKWWTFWAIGVRLFTAGLRQVAKPAFTAEVIFHATSADSHVVVRELGIACAYGSSMAPACMAGGWRYGDGGQQRGASAEGVDVAYARQTSPSAIPSRSANWRARSSFRVRSPKYW
jgi:hypothetical protein